MVAMIVMSDDDDDDDDDDDGGGGGCHTFVVAQGNRGRRMLGGRGPSDVSFVLRFFACSASNA